MLSHSLLAAFQGYAEDAEGNAHYDYPDVWTSFAKDALQTVFLWIAVALAAVLIAVAVFVRLKKPDALKSFTTKAIALACGFAATVVIAMLSLEFYEMNENGTVFSLVLYPAITVGIVVILGVAACYVASLYSKKALKISLIATISAFGCALVALLVCLGVYLSSGTAEDNNGAQITVSENVALYLCAVGLIAVIALIAFFFGRKDKKGFDTKAISYAAICIAMSFALSYLKLWQMPQGGSVTVASLLPLMLYSYMFGVRKGVFAGMIYGVLQAVQDPWIIHPAQFLLDYPIAFAAIGVSGMFAKWKKLENLPQVQFALGAVVAVVLRFFAHILSGVFAFSEYSTLDNVWIYSMAYNSFVFVDIAIALAAGVFALCSKTLVKQMKKFNAHEEPAKDSTAPDSPKNSIDE